MKQMETKMENRNYDIVVVGAGHAGCEAALAGARIGFKTLLTTLNLDSIGFLPCNPSIGGTAKGHLVFEIDALGGEMGHVADMATIHRRMLNETKGPAVHSLRAQTDKVRYHEYMKQVLENQDNLDILQCEITEILTKNGSVCGVKNHLEETINCKAVVVCTGVYLDSNIIIGNVITKCGPNGFMSATHLTKNLQALGLKIMRFKTGTPMRIDKRSINFDIFEEQRGVDGLPNFSIRTKHAPKNIASCYIGYTNQNTHNIIRKNLDKSPLYQGIIKGIGPRYCPSIEDKIVRFADKPRHQFFLEPEAMSTNEIYMQGVSTSLPVEVQRDILHSINGFENAKIMRYAYAIEYDAIDSTQLKANLEYKEINGLFFAGQINGTSGYEEAGAQGIIAGINACQYLKQEAPLILSRSDGYIGVLIDDLITKGTNEPYRMMTARAEYRLHLRQDNADARLTEKGYKVGLVSKSQYQKFKKKQKMIEEGKKLFENILPPNEKLIVFLNKNNEPIVKTGISVLNLIKRPNIDIYKLNNEFKIFPEYPEEVLHELNILAKYHGYLEIERQQIERQKELENTVLPEDIDYSALTGLRLEARQKLKRILPHSLGQAGRISGVSPADINILTIYLKKRNIKEKSKNG